MDETKKSVAKEENVEYNQEMMKKEFKQDHVAYCPVWNEKTKRYDMMILQIDSTTDQVVVVREPTRYDSMFRATQDTLKRVNDEMLRRTK